MTAESKSEPLSADAFKRAVETFGENLAKAVAAARPDDQADFLRNLGVEIRASAVAMEAESPETARALHLTANKLHDAAMLKASDLNGRIIEEEKP